MHERLDPDRRFGMHVARVIAGPFAERAFIDHVIRVDIAFERDLGIGRYRQAGLRHVDDLDTLADQATGTVIFILAIGHFQPGDHEQGRMHSGHNRNRARLATVKIFTHQNVAMLALGDHDRCRLGVMRLNAVSAVIDPARIRVLHHHHAGGADEVTAIEFVPLGRGDLHDVDVVTFKDILDQRAAIDLDRLMDRLVLHVIAPVIDQFDLRGIDGLAERDIDTRYRGQDIREHPATFRKARDVVEHDGRVGHLVHVDIDDSADFFVVIRTAHMLQLAVRF